jgi:hypothetical protein
MWGKSMPNDTICIAYIEMYGKDKLFYNDLMNE